MSQKKTKPEDGKPPAQESKSFISNIRDALGIIATAGSIVIGLLWISGRVFAAGFFYQLGIPLYHVDFPIWEYAEISWVPLLLYALVITASMSLIAAIMSWLLAPVFSKIDEWLSKPQKQDKATDKNVEDYRDLSKFMLGIFVFIFWLLCFSPLIALGDQWMRVIGENSGRVRILGNAFQVEILAASPLALGDTTLQPATSVSGVSELFVYDGLKLLIYNNGKYYLFREIDPVTCRPLQVYIVDEKQIVQANLRPAVSIASQCQGTTNQTQSNTPTNIPAGP